MQSSFSFSWLKLAIFPESEVGDRTPTSAVDRSESDNLDATQPKLSFEFCDRVDPSLQYIIACSQYLPFLI
ncbi:MAG: hypothetical protein KME17_31715 [Cyanosarcina radialis HA8281-LM2]|jgi:hypothetical protein|nr:hypothetical protein [Cyanosarcina radialis HA8281-LM2]